MKVIAKGLAVLLLSASLLVSCTEADSVDKAHESTHAEDRGKNVHPGSEAILVPTGPDAIGRVTGIEGVGLEAAADPSSAHIGRTIPDVQWQDATGRSGKLSDYRGQVVLINFWGTWCPPCRRELPDLVRLRESLGPQGFEIVGLALERPEPGIDPAVNLAAFAEAQNLVYPMVLADDQTVRAYGGINGVPTSFIVDRDGTIVSVIVGARSEADFRAVIEPIL